VRVSGWRALLVIVIAGFVDDAGGVDVVDGADAAAAADAADAVAVATPTNKLQKC
jgi:hypothetical protein